MEAAAYNTSIESKKEILTMKSLPYILGFLCGLAAVAVAVLVIRYVFKKKNTLLCGEYDERQKAVQGRGYKYAYFTMMIAVVLGGLFDQGTGIRWIEQFPFAMLCLWLSLCVFVTYCIAKDAYIARHARRKVLIGVFAATGVVNLAIAIREIACGEGILTAGRLNLTSSNLLTGAACLYIALALCVKAVLERRQEDAQA